MGLRFWDLMSMAAPIAASAIGGPVAGIAVGGLTGAGGSLARGEDWKTALLKGGLGAGSGALAAGATGALSKSAGNAAMNQSMGKILEAGLDEAGMPIVTDAALKAAGGMKAGALQGLSNITSKARGGEGTDDMLKTVMSGSKTLGQIGSMFEDQDQPFRFMQVQGMMRSPGMSPMYQYGSSLGGVRSSTGRRFY